MTAVLLAFLGGAVGSALRYLTDRAIQARHSIRFPFGTLTVNLVGCLILGLVSGAVLSAGWSPQWKVLLGTGFCGGLTTWSTFTVETVDLFNSGLRLRSAAYVAFSVSAGVGLAALGWALTD